MDPTYMSAQSSSSHEVTPHIVYNFFVTFLVSLSLFFVRMHYPLECVIHGFGFTGTLSKSKSFNFSNSKCEVQSREQPEKKKSCEQTSIIDKKTDGAIRKINKSVSFNNSSSGRQSIGQSKVKMMISPSSSRVDDLMSLKSAKGSSSIQNKHISKSDKPMVTSPVTRSCTSPSKNGKRVSSNSRPTEVHSSANKNLNPKLSQHFVNSSHSSKPSRHMAHEVSKCREDPGRIPLISYVLIMLFCHRCLFAPRC